MLQPMPASDASSPTRRVRLFRNGRNQAARIPREFELPGEDAVISAGQTPADSTRLKFRSWDTPGDLRETIIDVLAEAGVFAVGPEGGAEHLGLGERVAARPQAIDDGIEAIDDAKHGAPTSRTPPR